MTARPPRAVLIESLENRRLMAGTVGTATVAPQPRVATAVQPAAVAQRRVFLTGNSMTDGVNYGGLATLLARGGASVSIGRQTGSGYSQYANLSLRPDYVTGGVDPARPGNGNPWGNYKNAFTTGTWDVLTIQPHDRRLRRDVYNTGTPQEHDEGELPNSMSFLRVMAKNNPKGQVYVYARAARRTDLTTTNEPTGKPFDYSTEWLKTYNDTAPSNLPYFTRSRMTQFMPMLRDAQKADAATAGLPPARLIPVGEAYYHIDQMIKAGRFEGTKIKSVLDLYRDQSHPSDDVAGYVTALTFYASITGRDPRGVAPPSQYLFNGSRVAEPAVQALLQQAVYQAMTTSAYSGYTTPINSPTPTPTPTPKPPAPPAGTATFRGYVIRDKNANGTWDHGEIGLQDRTVWVDLDNDGRLDSNEPTRLTATNGAFEFKNLAAGTVYIREVVPSRWKQTSPTNNAPLTAKLTAGQVKSGQYFAVRIV
ncbi:MAG TPA: SdrD B-like domain-containing protein [Tepidisphaeraceae bacterium]|jgi:hypothetical protein